MALAATGRSGQVGTAGDRGIVGGNSRRRKGEQKKKAGDGRLYFLISSRNFS
jgi:hypothetical protein